MDAVLEAGAGSAASSDALLGLAKGADALDATPAGVPAADAPNPRAQWVGMALSFGAMARDAHPLCRENWTEEKLRRLGEALADCAERYGWKNTGALVGHPLVALALASGSLAWPFVAPHVAAWMEKQKPAQPAGAEGKS